ncbi:MAG TPA: adenylyl-sulfate kinase [Bacteroidales bacterium]|mgnify:CR=1 FL=1|nr:adenylyl-sulfate kinase [Bacteroidales bacterium]
MIKESNISENNIHTVFDKILGRFDKEKLLKQHARVIWMTGLSGSGKTTIARGIELELNQRLFLTQILDGDNIRAGINNNLGFSVDDRLENIRRISEVSKLFLNCGIICINSFISPTIEIRQIAYDIIGRENIIEIFVNAPLEVCEQRDTKGLYKMAREGKIKQFTGIDSPFEPPANPDIELRTAELSVEDSLDKCLRYILPIITYRHSL